MKDRSSGETLVRILAIVAVALFAFIIAVTVWGFATGAVGKASRAAGASDGAGRTLFDAKKADPTPEAVAALDPAGKTAVFADIGLLRARTADSLPVTVVVSPYFPYPSADVAFQEELVGKTRTIRTAVLDWFASKKISEIGTLGESGVKRELVDRINARLTLGKIDTLYFGEYLVIE